jgi:hypothetical protein
VVYDAGLAAQWVGGRWLAGRSVARPVVPVLVGSRAPSGSRVWDVGVVRVAPWARLCSAGRSVVVASAVRWVRPCWVVRFAGGVLVARSDARWFAVASVVAPLVAAWPAPASVVASAAAWRVVASAPVRGARSLHACAERQ